MISRAQQTVTNVHGRSFKTTELPDQHAKKATVSLPHATGILCPRFLNDDFRQAAPIPYAQAAILSLPIPN